MKFTEEDARKELTDKLKKDVGEPVLSEKTIKNKVERSFAKLSKNADDATELADFVEDIYPDLLDGDKNLRNSISEVYKDAEEKAKKKYEDANKPDKPKPEENTGDKDERLDAVLKELDEIKAERENEKKERTASQKKSELKSKLKEKGISNDKWADAYLKKLNVSADTDIDAEASDALLLYNQSAAIVDSTGKTPSANGGNLKEDPHRDDDVKAIIRRNRGITEKKE